MELIRLPLKITHGEDEDETQDDVVDLGDFVNMFVNHALKELKEALNRFHSISETSSRRDLSTFFRQKEADFECLFLFLGGVEYLDQVNANNRRIKQIHWVGEEYVKTADRLAYLFEASKLSTTPKCDVLTPLQTIYNPDYLLPRLRNESFHGEINFEAINRLNRMYLEKEDLYMYDNVKIEQGVVMLSSEPFSFSMALCGEISKPEWKLINVRSGCESFSKHLLFSMPHSIAVISEFLRMYRTYSRGKKIFQAFKRASREIDMEVKGYYRKFEAAVHTFRILVSVGYSGVVAKLFVKENVFPVGEDLMEAFEDRMTELLRNEGKNAAFSFESGFKTVDRGGTRTFRNFNELDTFLDRERENTVFYSFFENRFLCYRDHKNVDFGEKNVFIARNGLFVCVGLFSLTDTHMEVRTFVGSCGIADFLTYTRVFLVMKNGMVVGVANEESATDMKLEIEAVHKYFEEHMDLLLTVYKFTTLVNGEVEIRDKIALTHSVGTTQVTLVIENEEDFFIITTENSKADFYGLDIVYEYITFVLTFLRIIECSKSVDVAITATKFYEGISMRFSGLGVTFVFGSRSRLVTDSYVLDHVLDHRISLKHVFDIMCCFRAVFSAELVPTTSTPSGLVFVFRYSFLGRVRLRLIDRMSFGLILEGFAKDVFGTARVIASGDMEFVKVLANVWCKERLGLVADVAKRNYKVTSNGSAVHVLTPCIGFSLSVENDRCVFRIDNVGSVSLDPESMQAVCRYFTRVITVGRDVSGSLNFLSNTEEFSNLLKRLKSQGI